KRLKRGQKRRKFNTKFIVQKTKIIMSTFCNGLTLLAFSLKNKIAVLN
ncbi:MAG: hypothetical protein ACI9QN_001728, partial [Arcticibacterium sp.]